MNDFSSQRRAQVFGLSALAVAAPAAWFFSAPAHAGMPSLPLRQSELQNAYGQFNADMVSVEVVDGMQGQPFAIFNSSRGTFVGGTTGVPYQLRLRNLSANRVLVVVSVDGVNVVSGETASAQQTGYVIDAFGDVTIDGWRKSMSEVARFVFSAPGQSYASRTGRAGNVGVIGVAVFPEAQRTPRQMAPNSSNGGEVQKSAPAAAESNGRYSADSARAPAAPGLGTAHGDRQVSEAQTTEFKRASARPSEVIEISYDTLDNLTRRGIALRHPVMNQPRRPSPFPADGFVPDPPRR